MWNKVIIIKLLTCAAMFAAATVNATTEQALVCQGCNYQQAKSLAMSSAQPLPQCQDGSGTGFPTLETQICFSQPKKFIVFDAVSRQAYPFEVYHANQGGSMRDLRASVTTRDRTASPTAIELLNTGVDMHAELMSSFDQIARQLVTQLNQQQLLMARSVSKQALGSAQAGCESDSDAQAIYDAFDASSIGTLQRNAQITQREQTETIFDSFRSFFDRNTASLSTVGFQITKHGVTVGAGIVFSPKTSSFSAIYNSGSNISYVEGRGVNALGTPTLVYDIKTNQAGNLVAQVNQDHSYLSSNVSLSSITSGITTTVPVSSCAADAIASVLPDLQFSTASDGGIGDNNPPPGSGGSPGSSCTITKYGKVDGTVVLILTIRIC